MEDRERQRKFELEKLRLETGGSEGAPVGAVPVSASGRPKLPCFDDTHDEICSDSKSMLRE